MFSVAIDGPAGAGKSTIAKLISKELDFIYVDTGALYRTIGLAFMKANVDLNDELKVSSCLSEIKISLKYDNGIQRVLLDGIDVSDEIRTPEASMMASKVSAIPSVRAALLDMQRDMSKHNNVVMDGRDIGTVVLPNADVKIFLTASIEERAKRRFLELKEKNIDASYEEIYNDIEKRDYQDSHREIAPLKPADDSIIVDTSNYNLEEVIEILKGIINNKK